MLLIPVVLVIGGILALVLYLEKDLHPIDSKATARSRPGRRTASDLVATRCSRQAEPPSRGGRELQRCYIAARGGGER